MALLTLKPARLCGNVTPPPSKSIAHRALILSALSGGTVSPLEDSEDILATKRCLSALKAGQAQYDCGESGSTLRFMIPLALALTGGGTFYRAGRLPERPITVYQELFDKATFTMGEPLKLSGTIEAKAYKLRGDVSSQFITGLLLALPLVKGDSSIHVLKPFESSSYVELTLQVMKAYGVEVLRKAEYDFVISGGQRYTPADYIVEADYSQAAVFLVAKALGHAVDVDGLDPDSKQGDRVILDIIAHPQWREIDASDCPDIIPMVALMRALSQGETRIVNCARLRLKECDRLLATVSLLKNLGANISAKGDSMVINGVSSLNGGVTLDCLNDHRMAMMLSIAALHCVKPIVITGVECVQKSWPSYFDVYRALGGIAL